MADSAPEGTPTLTTLPIFPLQSVLLPGAHLPMHIFEPRYRQLISDLVTGVVPNQEFGVVAIRSSMTHEVDVLDDVYDIGCTAILRQAQRLPDGRFDIVVTGSRRFRLTELDRVSSPYLQGGVRWLPDDPIPAEATEVTDRLAEVARTAHARYCDQAWEREDWDEPHPEADPAELAYQLAADCLLALPDRQWLLAETHPLRRLRIACRVLTREAGFLTTLRAVPTPTSELHGPATPSSLN